MTLAVYASACLLIGMTLLRLGTVQHATREFRKLAGGLAALRAPGLSDVEKEARARAAALNAFPGALRLFVHVAAVAAAAVVPVLLADRAGLVPAAEIWRFASRGDVILGTTAVALALVMAEGRLSRGRA